MFLPGLSAGNFRERVDDVRGYRLVSDHAQVVDYSVAFETATRIPQYVTERVLQYKLVSQPLDVLPVNRIRRARRTVIDVYACWSAEYDQTRFVLHYNYTNNIHTRLVYN